METIQNNTSSKQKAPSLERKPSHEMTFGLKPRSKSNIKEQPKDDTLTIPGVTHPYQLLKYSAISRCGMVQKQYEDISSNDGPQRIMMAKINQDSFSVQKSYPKDTRPFNWMFEIFDGHGPQGEVVSQHAAKVLPSILEEPLKEICVKYSDLVQEATNNKNYEGLKLIINERNELIKEAIDMAFFKTEEEINGLKNENGSIAELSGCTGSILIVLEDFLVVANVGDSPAIIFRQMQNQSRFKAEQLSIDHKPDMEEERKRILEAGGVLD